jgi:hypothetical protein
MVKARNTKLSGGFMSIRIFNDNIFSIGQKICTFSFMGDHVKVWETCDHCYEVELSKTQLAQLIAALQAMHDKMPDNKEVNK